LPLVLARTARVVVDCDPRLASMLRRAHPGLAGILAPNAPCAGVAAQIAMGDLPRVLQLTAREIAALPIVLGADAEKMQSLRAKYQEKAQGRAIIGIAWASPKAKYARAKGAALEHWGALLSRGHFFVSLQYGDADAEIEAARARFGADIYCDPDVDQMRSIEDFATQIAALDHVVSVSNTTVHVAGAIGARCVVLTPPGRGLHWYWGLQGATTPWYPSLRLVRRPFGAPWDEEIAAAAALVEGDLGA
jgi:hypothetical protein